MDALHARQSKLKRKLEALEAEIKQQKEAEKQQQTAQLRLQAKEFVAPLLEKLTPLEDLFFRCAICHNDYPRHVPDSTLPVWWQDWMVEFPCGHPLCLRCFVAGFEATEVSWEIGNIYTVVSCPFCKKPQYLSPIRSIDVKRCDTEMVPRDSAICVIVQPEPDSSDDESVDLDDEFSDTPL
jgi:hypothetical protein